MSPTIKITTNKKISCYKAGLIILTAVLFIMNLTFYLRATVFNDYSDNKRGIHPRDFQDEKVKLSDSVAVRVLNSAGRLDNSRRYKIYDFVYVGEQWSNHSKSQNLCLASHVSADQLFKLVELAETWQGLISLAVFVPGESYQVAVLYFQYLQRCFDSIRQNVSVHFVHPVDQPPTTGQLDWEWQDNCHNWEIGYKTVVKKMQLKNPEYPQNHLRNVARKGCQTPYVFLVDVDIVPRAHLALQMEIFLQNITCTKCAFVVPAYEIYENILTLPENKAALKKMIEKKNAQFYHKKVFAPNQNATNHPAWEKMPDSKGIEIAYSLPNFPFFYEPFYIAKDEIPAHDERFIGYGFTRNTQTYEMHIAGYQFKILNSAFVLHRGLKKKLDDVLRANQTKRNSKLLNKFKQEIYVRYNYSIPTKNKTPTKEKKSKPKRHVTKKT